jgi:hypothetical protein
LWDGNSKKISEPKPAFLRRLLGPAMENQPAHFERNAMTMKSFWLLCPALVTGIFLEGCQFSNDERCPDGFFYVENLYSCCEVGSSIYHPKTQRCHLTKQQPPNCPNQDDVFLSVSYAGDSGEPIIEEACCPSDMTFYRAEDCVEPLAGDTDSQEPKTGLGESCVPGRSDCDDYEANTCLKHPLNVSDSYCTVLDCSDSAFCGAGYACCDCTEQEVLQPKAVACLKTADADLAGAFCDCDL